MKATTYAYEDIEFTTAHEDCHECEGFLKNAYETFGRSICVEMHTGSEVCWGQVSYKGK